MSVRFEARLWVTQRATAAILAACVVVHLVTIIYAVRLGLSAADVLGNWLIQAKREKGKT